MNKNGHKTTHSDGDYKNTKKISLQTQMNTVNSSVNGIYWLCRYLPPKITWFIRYDAHHVNNNRTLGTNFNVWIPLFRANLSIRFFMPIAESLIRIMNRSSIWLTQIPRIEFYFNLVKLLPNVLAPAPLRWLTHTHWCKMIITIILFPLPLQNYYM